jgi:hypothetical protein
MGEGNEKATKTEPPSPAHLQRHGVLHGRLRCAAGELPDQWLQPGPHVRRRAMRRRHLVKPVTAAPGRGG